MKEVKQKMYKYKLVFHNGDSVSFKENDRIDDRLVGEWLEYDYLVKNESNETITLSTDEDTYIFLGSSVAYLKISQD